MPAASTATDEPLRDAVFALRLSSSARPRLFWGVVAIGVGRSVLPAILALVARGLLNALTVTGAAMEGAGVWMIAGLGVMVASALATSGYQYLVRRLQDEMDLVVGARILEHANTLEYSRFENPAFQDVLQRARQDSALHFSSFLAMVLNTTSNAFLTFSLVVLLGAVVPLFLLVLLPIGAGYLALQSRLARRNYDEISARATKFRWNHYYARQLTEASSVAENRLLGLGPLFVSRFRDLLAGFRDRNRGLLRQELGVDVGFGVLSALAVYFVLVRVVGDVVAGVLMLGDLGLFGAAGARLRSALQETIAGFAQARRNLLHVGNLRMFLALQPIPRRSGSKALAAPRGAIEVDHVTFTYAGSPRPALADVSLHIEPGETIALVGDNGAGKTTLAKLLVRLHDVDRGAIRFDGIDMRDIPQDVLWRQIAFVAQDFARYEATAGDNLAFGDWQRLLGHEAEIEELARRTDVHGLIAALPNGYDTMLGLMFGEHTLSGGQWQQIALARAFARDAAVLILDEPTARLDARAEARLFDRFKEQARNKTTLLISHRFSTVSMADRIVVLDHGRIIETGTHAQLVEMGGHYAELYRLHRRQPGDAAQDAESATTARHLDGKP